MLQQNCSFAWDMQVLTADGYQAIVDVEPGVDLVWSKNELTGEMLLQPVLEALYYDYSETVYLEVENDANGVIHTIVSNKVHPYFVRRTSEVFAEARALNVASKGGMHVTSEYQGRIGNGHWIEAADVLVGDRMLGADENWHSVVSVQIIKEPIRAYNIDVANTDNYFIRGASSNDSTGVWVHNCDVTSSVGKEIGILRDAAKGKGNFGLGSGSRAEADKLGMAWVGDGYKIASDGKTLVSKDGLKQYRPPSYKPKLDKTQADFEQRFP